MQRTPKNDSPTVARYRPSKPRVAAGLALAATGFVLVFFVVTRWPGGPVLLMTEGGTGQGGCFLNFAVGELVVDPVAGTAITQVNRGLTRADDREFVTPVKWPAGYTARRSGVEVEVLNTRGDVVARTGGTYRLQGGYEGNADLTSGAWLTCSMIPPMENWTPAPH